MEIKHLEVQLHVVKHGDNPGDNADGRSNQKWIIQKTFLGNLRDVWKPAESLVSRAIERVGRGLRIMRST